MKKGHQLLLLFWIFMAVAGYAQKPVDNIHFRNGSIQVIENVRNNPSLKTSLRPSFFQNKFYILARFNQLPDSAEKATMARAGIRISHYLSDNTFYAAITDSLQTSDYLRFNISGIYNLSTDFKYSASLQKKIRERKFRITPEEPVAVSFYRTISYDSVKEALVKAGAKIVTTKFNIPHLIFMEANTAVLKTVAALPFVNYINQQVLKDIPVNYNNRGVHALNALSAVSGRNLQGKGVTIGLGDDANPSSHIDFSNRLIIRTPNPYRDHGTHTAGTLAGAGIKNPVYKGMAPGATIISKSYSDVLADAQTYITDNNMVLTSNSYFSGQSGCVGDGEYNFLSYYVDYQQNIFPELLHVFASGNDGNGSCSPYVKPYTTIKSGFQCGKNVLTVGNYYTSSNIISPSSSSGPVDDGRIKPEIVAGGVNITSTFPNNNYASQSGTSMSTPTVTGTLALLDERFRQLYGGSNPPGALVKAIACNSATDAGNPGPDFIFGFGILNARKAIETVEKGTFFSDIITNGSTKSYALPILANVHQVKIMLYWSDPEFAGGGPVTLVNNLNLRVTTPSAAVRLPLVLNPAAGSVANNAVEATDNLNNIEQVVLNTPASGSYTISVNGASVPAGPQRFYIVYEITEPSVTVEYPFGNETWVPGQTETIRWNAAGGDSFTFTAEYSADNGGTWTVIDNNIPATSRSLSWTAPSTEGSLYLVRVTRNSTAYTDRSDYPFTILSQPVISSATNPCQGYASLTWSAVTGATGYEVMMLNSDSMQTIAAVTTTDFLVQGLDKNKTYWFAIRAMLGTAAGRRSEAISIQPSAGACTLSNFDNDVAIDSFPGLSSGRMFTLSQLASAHEITIRINNLGNISTSGVFNVSYRINGGAIVSESVATAISGHSTLNYTFSAKANLSLPGQYKIEAWVDYPADIVHTNDTLNILIKQLQNAPVALVPSYTESFETAADTTYSSASVGLAGLDRCDFNADNANGRVRTFINSGFPRTGTRCVTLDQIFNTGSLSSDSLTSTFNLSSYTTADNILLNFYYKNHGIDTSLPGNAVWLRGSETSPWIRVFTIPVTPGDIGGYRASPFINVTETLKNAVPAQNFSSSFQVRLGESGLKPANSPDAPGINIDHGISYDDVSLILTVNDVSVRTILQPVSNGICNLSATETVSVQVDNTSSVKLFNVPIAYNINGTVVTENIDSIAANSALVYNFAATANLSAFQQYTLSAWTAYAGDTYHANDTATILFRTSPLVSAFPYLEGFESSEGYWFTGGINSSWMWGAPSKPVISAAASGSYAWVTGLTGTYNTSEYSFLYSPCFNISSLSNPALGFSHIFRTEDNCPCDNHWAEYSLDDINWTKLGASGVGKNWYDDATNQAWKLSRTSWHESIINIPVAPSKIRFRFVMNSDGGLEYDGVGIDNVRIFDSSFTTLPLTLLSFKAEREKSTGILTWITAKEVNTEKFIIQKSNNNQDFQDAGTIMASGRASGSYSFSDYDLGSGTTFYRLKMMDKDGRFTWSPIRTIDYEADGLSVSVHPNPVVKGSVYITSTAGCDKIELKDISGRSVKTLAVRGLKHTVDVHDISKGTYFITIHTSMGKITRKVIIE